MGAGGASGRAGAGGGGGTMLGGAGGSGSPGAGGTASPGGGAGGGTGGRIPNLGGSGGGAKDGGLPDAASDVPVIADVPSTGDGDMSCGPGYPVGSQKPMGDGCNTCYCESGGYFMCTTRQCPMPDASAEVVLDAGRCPAGQLYCQGCTPETGTCGLVCPAAPCAAPDAGCMGSGCSTADASLSRDANVESGSKTCAQVTTQAECDGRGDCHSLYRSIGACGCGGSPGCCMHFISCTDGATATCTPPATIGCTIATPACDSPFVLSYTPGCYEGCVKPTECGP